MATLTRPLFSMRASGHVGRQVTYLDHPHGPRAKAYSTPTGEPTAAQIAHRTLFAQARNYFTQIAMDYRIRDSWPRLYESLHTRGGWTQHAMAQAFRAHANYATPIFYGAFHSLSYNNVQIYKRTFPAFAPTSAYASIRIYGAKYPDPHLRWCASHSGSYDRSGWAPSSALGVVPGDAVWFKYRRQDGAAPHDVTGIIFLQF
jgi:hypothetical protein